MKTSVTPKIIIFFVLIPFVTFSQNLPNYDFENWESDGTFNNPASWGTSNLSVFSIVNFNTVFQDTSDKYSGSSSAKLITIQKNVAGDYVKVAGLVTLGHFDVDLSTRKAVVKGGIPFNARPGKLSGFYKYYSPGTDSCSMIINLTKFNNTEQKTDTIGSGIYTSGNTAEWTSFEAPVVYNSDIEPDSLNIIIISSDTSLFVVGSTLWIDKLYVDAVNTSIENPNKTNIFSIFPNPAQDRLEINIEYSVNSIIRYSIFNSLGEIKSSSSFYGNSKTIDISTFNKGVYFIEITIDNSKHKKTFIIN